MNPFNKYLAPLPLFLGLSLSACTLGPDFKRPPLDGIDALQQKSFSNSINNNTQHSKQKTKSEQPIISVWNSFKDPKLDKLIELGRNYNSDIKIATANLQFAMTLDRDSKLDSFPQPLTTFSGAELKDSENKSFPPENQGNAYQDFTLTQSFNWELDLYGRISRLRESTGANTKNLLKEAENIQLITTAEITRQYILLRGNQAQLASTEANAHRQKETWDLTQSRFDAGVSTPIDVQRAKSQYYATRATIPSLEVGIKRALHRLSVLTGRSATASYANLKKSQPIPQLPSLNAIYITPKQLLEDRPDIQAAEARLQKATAEIGMAKSLWYPKISLGADVGFASEDMSNLSDKDSLFSLLGVNIRWAGLGFNRVAFRIDRAKATAQAAHEAYKKTVLIALEEAENALAEYQSTEAITQNLAESSQAAEKAAELAQQRYEGGIIGFLEVLDAERRQLEVENQLAAAKTQQALAVVALFQSFARR